MTIRIVAMLAASSVLLTSCGLATSDSPSPYVDWHLQSGSVDGEPIPLFDHATISMTIDDDTISGIADCNHYDGLLRIDGDAVNIGVMWTGMGCDGDVMQAEAAYIAALAAVASFERSDDRLVFRSGDVELVDHPVLPVADAQLVGPTWMFDVRRASGGTIARVTSVRGHHTRRRVPCTLPCRRHCAATENGTA